MLQNDTDTFCRKSISNYLFIIYIPFTDYKNKVKECACWDDKVLKWCLGAAKENGLKPGDYMGGFAIDEMKIQVIPQFQKTAHE